ncbi:MAG: xanthine dehydrogenase iron-sulfur cluster and FAD-binding subunit A [Acidimicrobiales bacterium]|jgi:xanthine dehydrogenase iron-sulfur cluster and FAD-binding subunit A
MVTDASIALHEVQRSPSSVGRHVCAETLEEVLELLATHRERARVVAGGTDLLVELDRRVGGDVDVLIDLTRIPGLTAIHEAPDAIHLGPLVTHNQCVSDPLIAAKALPLAQACLEVGSPALRNRATVVGNVVTASPANDTISALRVLEATVHLASNRGQRAVPLAEFHTGIRQTIREPDELVTGLSFPAMQSNERGMFLKLGLRRAQAISVVHLAMVCSFDEGGPNDGAVLGAKIALGSVAPTIVRSELAEAVLVGGPLDAERIGTCARAASAAVDPIDDARATAQYRSELIEVMVSRGLSAIRRGSERQSLPTAPPFLGGPVVVAPVVGADLGVGSSLVAEVNGQEVTAGWIDGTLLDWLREPAGLTGTKEGCAEGECGACTVHLDGTAVLSCLVPSGRAHGATVVTIEGLAPADGGLGPLQQAFVDNAAVQCGYCIPGFLMAGAKLQEEFADPSPEQLKLGLSGNLCRCTGYYSIERAFSSTSPKGQR